MITTRAEVTTLDGEPVVTAHLHPGRAGDRLMTAARSPSPT